MKEEKKKQADLKSQKDLKKNSLNEDKLREREARIQLDTEILHQNEESQRRALSKVMLADASGNRPSFPQSCQNLLVNYQGI